MSINKFSCDCICLQWICQAKFFIYLFETFIITEEAVRMLRVSQYLPEKHLSPSLLFYKYTCRPAAIFIKKKLYLLKKVLPNWCFPDNWKQFLTLKKKALLQETWISDINRKSNYATFYLKLRQDFYIWGNGSGLYKVLSFGKITKSSK